MSDGSAGGQSGDSVEGLSLPAKRPPKKTPLFEAINASRYHRQGLIRRIQETTKRPLICYVAGVHAGIDREDTVGFVELLHNLHGETDLDVLLHTGGGDIDAAEKLITMLRTKVGNAVLRIIVPDFAKSAGTLMVLGADSVLMSDTSELGPIDPQFVLGDNNIAHSIQNYLDAYETHCVTLRKNPSDVPASIMLQKLDPATVVLFQGVLERARKFAERQLRLGMFKNGAGNWTQTAGELLDTRRWQSHGQMISWQDATDAKIGLRVEYSPPDSPLWEQCWQLYCHQRLAVGDRQKLFESDFVCLPIDSSA
jgi:hypothetical protein